MEIKQRNHVLRCRLCACESDNFSNIFDNQELRLQAKIKKLLPVMVMPLDPLPHVVCQECIDKLNSFNEFFEGSLRAERFLKMLLDPPRENNPKLGRDEKGAPKENKNEVERNLSCFIKSPITSKDSVFFFTCRKCFRTFTKESWALTHSCVRIEDCGELETIGSGEKALPPLKIRLFSMRSGLFVCYLCQMSFKDKTELIDHIKEHLLEGEGRAEKCNRHREKRKGQCSSGVEGPKPAKRKKRKKRERDASVPMEDCQDQTYEKCRNLCNPTSIASTEERIELTTQHPEQDTLKPEKQSGILITDESQEEPKLDDEVIVLEEDNTEPLGCLSCTFCDKAFPTREAAIAHQMKHLEGYPEDPTFLCSICARTFTNRDALLEHEREHSLPEEGGVTWREESSHEEKRSQVATREGVVGIILKKIPEIELM